MAERRITVERAVPAPPAPVWAVLADFPNLAAHWGGIRASRAVGDQTHGVGARREVDLRPVGTLVETVTVWEEGSTLATSNQPSATVPFTHAEATVELRPEGDGTVITFDYRYLPRGGPLGRLTGPVLDKLLKTSFTIMLAATEQEALHPS